MGFHEFSKSLISLAVPWNSYLYVAACMHLEKKRSYHKMKAVIVGLIISFVPNDSILKQNWFSAFEIPILSILSCTVLIEYLLWCTVLTDKLDTGNKFIFQEFIWFCLAVPWDSVSCKFWFLRM